MGGVVFCPDAVVRVDGDQGWDCMLSIGGGKGGGVSRHCMAFWCLGHLQQDTGLFRAVCL